MKEGKVQSCIWGDTSFNNGVGIVTGILEMSALAWRNLADLFLKSWSATVFTPGMWQAVTLISKCAENNQRYLNRYMEIASLEDPFLMDSTTLWLSHLNSTLQSDNNGPHTAQASTIGKSSFTIICNRDHSLQISGSRLCPPVGWLPVFSSTESR